MKIELRVNYFQRQTTETNLENKACSIFPPKWLPRGLDRKRIVSSSREDIWEEFRQRIKWHLQRRYDYWLQVGRLNFKPMSQTVRTRYNRGFIYVIFLALTFLVSSVTSGWSSRGRSESNSSRGCSSRSPIVGWWSIRGIHGIHGWRSTTEYPSKNWATATGAQNPLESSPKVSWPTGINDWIHARVKPTKPCYDASYEFRVTNTRVRTDSHQYVSHEKG